MVCFHLLIVYLFSLVDKVNVLYVQKPILYLQPKIVCFHYLCFWFVKFEMQNAHTCILTLKTLKTHRQRKDIDRKLQTLLNKTNGQKKMSKKDRCLFSHNTKNETNDDFDRRIKCLFEEYTCNTTVLEGYRISTAYICSSLAYTMLQSQTHYSLTLPSHSMLRFIVSLLRSANEYALNK